MLKDSGRRKKRMRMKVHMKRILIKKKSIEFSVSLVFIFASEIIEIRRSARQLRLGGIVRRILFKGVIMLYNIKGKNGCNLFLAEIRSRNKGAFFLFWGLY